MPGKAPNGCTRSNCFIVSRPAFGKATDTACVAIPGKNNDMAGEALFSRRSLLAGVIAAACGRKRATRYQGWLFVGSSAEKGIAVADLASFHRVATIALPCAPDQLFQSNGRVYATCREGRTILAIDVEGFRVAGRI